MNNMRKYKLKAKLLSPLIVQKNRQSNVSGGLNYLPGSTFRGAVAGQFLRIAGEPGDDKFRRLFIDDPVMFPDLLPSDGVSGVSVPLPMTAYSCKRKPGFLSGEKKHGVVDELAAMCGAKIKGISQKEQFTCRKCKEDLKPFNGFWNNNVSKPRLFTPSQSYSYHTGIDRTTGTLAESVFFMVEGIDPEYLDNDGKLDSQFLTGDVWLNDAQFEILNSLLSDPVFAGSDKTRGHGELEVEIAPVEHESFDVEKWNDAFREKVNRETGVKLPEEVFFSIDLISAAILVDRFLRPTYELNLDLEGVHCESRFLKGTTVRGWQSAWGLPKNEDRALMPGSVFLYRYTGSDRETLYRYLENVSINGVGLRRAEGFGRVNICNLLHTQEVL
ncbi:MAG TPA: RAMP superfamily CRISPR-associated protein [bacterium]|nr:RAMP superfamily CRISPR-associated protein [bacterium]